MIAEGICCRWIHQKEEKKTLGMGIDGSNGQEVLDKRKYRKT